jgi:hypothetical protein
MVECRAARGGTAKRYCLFLQYAISYQIHLSIEKKAVR